MKIICGMDKYPRNKKASKPRVIIRVKRLWSYLYKKGGARGRTRTGTRVKSRGILSPLCLPISPPGQRVEAEAGIEPAYKALQASA